MTWTQLGVHAKPCGLLNVDGYYDGLLTFFEHATREEFLKPTHRQIVVAHADPAALVDRIVAWEPPAVTRWIDQSES